MREFRLFQDLPGRGKYHSCILTSYSFDFYFFDTQIRRFLQQKGIYNIIVLADEDMLEQSFGWLSDGAQHLLSQYSLTPVSCTGAFHPKMALFFGEKAMMLHIGSGNLTSGGQGKNHEIFSTVAAEDKQDRHYPILLNAANYLYGLLSDTEGQLAQQLRWISAECGLLPPHFDKADRSMNPLSWDNSTILLLPAASSLYDQVLPLLPAKEVEEIVIQCPFYDSNGKFLKQIQTDFSQAHIRLVVQPGATILPEGLQLSHDLSLWNWESTDRAQKFPLTDHRFNHSKVYLFKTRQDVFLLHGSPNATAVAWGLHPYLKNEEAALLYRFSKDAMPNLSMEADERLTEVPQKGYAIADQSSSVKPRANRRLKIKGADRNRRRLTIHLSKPLQDGESIIFFNSRKEQLSISVILPDGERTISLDFRDYPALKAAQAVQVCHQEQTISNLAFIHDTISLRKGHPSKENRKLQQLLDQIHDGRASELAIFDHLNRIISNTTTANSSKERKRSTSSSARSSVSVTYDEVLEQEELEKHPLASSRLVMDALQLLFQHIARLQDEQNMDQEEDGAKKSGDRGERMTAFKPPKVFSSDQVFQRQQKKIFAGFEKYCSYLDRQLFTEDIPLVISVNNLCFYWVFLHQLILLAGKPFLIEGDEGGSLETDLLPISGNTGEFDHFIQIALEIVARFVLLLQKVPLEDTSDEFHEEEMQFYRRKAAQVSLMILLLIMQEKPQYSDWCALVWANVLEVFDWGKEDLFWADYSIIREFLHFENDLKKDTLESLNQKVKSVSKELSKEVIDQKYIKIPEAGIFSILKRIPKGNPKSLKLGFPGFEYQQYPLFYVIGSGKFLPGNSRT